MSTSASKRTAFVTGASYGVGAATALALAQAGLTVAISATRAENLESILRSIEATGAQALPIVLDLRSQSSISETLKHIRARLGHLDLLVRGGEVVGADASGRKGKQRQSARVVIL
jgi:NADP-dependent 3-hydroxy acid dehydrogenase YdfG